MAKPYQKPEFETLNDVEDIITSSLGDNDVEDPWGDELPDDF